MKKTISVLATVVALGASLAIAGENWKGEHGGRHRGEAGFSQKMAEKLNLSEAQKTQIKDIEKSFREQNKAFFESAKATREQFRAAKQANDTAKIEALRPTMESQRAQMKQLRQTQMEQIRTILTPDQRAQFDAWKAQHESRRNQK
jgi:Spy/CpxP family protein refolding chaperone